jgi:hypothetical protein
VGELFDRLSTSTAWQRLQDRSPQGADPYAVGVKHDLMQVLQTVVAAADEAHTAALRADAAHAALLRDLYEPDEGDFAKARERAVKLMAHEREHYEERYGSWTTWLKVVAGGIAVSLFAFLLQALGGG